MRRSLTTCLQPPGTPAARGGGQCLSSQERAGLADGKEGVWLRAGRGKLTHFFPTLLAPFLEPRHHPERCPAASGAALAAQAPADAQRQLPSEGPFRCCWPPSQPELSLPSPPQISDL